MPAATSGDAIRYEHFHTADPEAVKHFFSNAYTPGWRIRDLSHGATITHRRCQTDLTTLDEVRIDGAVTCEIRPVDSVVAIQPRAGSMVSDPADRVDTAVIATDDLPHVIHADAARFHVVTIDERLLSRVAAERNELQLQHVRFLDHRPRSGPAARAWTRALDYVVASFTCAESAHQPVLVGAAAHLLSAALLECFPRNTDSGQDLLGSPLVPPGLKRAVSFMHRHCGDGIGINDVADALSMTTRAVQYLFRHHLDTTPTEYLRRIRLHRAHQDLLVGDRVTTTVGEIAQRWGFSHTGRFAALYRTSYGQSPHATLHQ